VAAVVWQADKVLLVCQQGPDDAEAYWSLPGGVAAPGETLIEALARELREETSLVLVDPGRLLYCAQLVEPENTSIAFVFETEACEGELRCADPDALVSAAEFVPPAEALERLAALPWRNMREPISAYLRGEVGAGAVWMYRPGSQDRVLEAVVVPGVSV
jgi:8-oxo-dGTP diphosphatase